MTPRHTAAAPPALARYAAELRSLHRGSTPVPCVVDIRPQQLARFLGGFASAEAHFGASAHGHPRFVINLRADDGPLLARFHEVLGIGILRDVRAAGGSKRPSDGM